MPVRQIDERVVADLWERQAYDPSALAALGFRVLFRGLPSDAGGPDYQDAVLTRGGRSVVSGDIEFHVSVSDWYAHGHHRDPHYESVVLHVVWDPAEEETRTASGRVVPTLALRGSVPSTLPVQLGAPGLAHPCVAAYAALSSDDLAAAIQRAALDRFYDRTAQMEADLQTVAPDAVAYTAVLEALGYASNRPVFRALAEAAPYDWIMSLPPDQRETALLEAAGLGGRGYDTPVRLRLDAWRLSRLRPANHPALRLAGMAVLLDRLRPSLSDALTVRLLDAHPRPREAVDVLLVRDGNRSPIGAGRATEILASAVLPFLAALWPERAEPRTLYAALPSPPATRWTRKMVGQMAESGHSVRVARAVDHQGLHRLYHGHCRYERRSGCPVCGGVAAGSTADTGAGSG